MTDLLVAVVLFACICAGAWWLEKNPGPPPPRNLRGFLRWLYDEVLPPGR